MEQHILQQLLSDPYELRLFLRSLTDEEILRLKSQVENEARHRARKVFGDKK